jgi:imidazolonepropionase-like amidohydrolase
MFTDESKRPRRSTVAFLLFAASLASGGRAGAGDRTDATPAPPPRAVSVALVGATVVDGTGGPPLADAVVVVEGERVVAVGPRATTKPPAGATVVDVSGKWIVPGLIDAHVHFFQSGGLYTRPDAIDLRSTRSYAEELAWIKRRLPNTFARYLACGVTSVVDVGGPFWNFDVRELAGRTELAPRVAVAGPLVSTFVPPQLQCDDPPIVLCTTAEEADALIDRELAREPDLIKIWFIHRNNDDLKKQTELVRAAIEHAHAAAVRVAVHATQLEVARAAVEAGADVLVHSVDDRPVDDAFLQLLREHDVVYTTTLVVDGGYGQVLGQDLGLIDFETSHGDPDVMATWGDLAKLPEGQTGGAFAPKRRAPRDRMLATQQANLRAVLAFGVADADARSGRHDAICVAAGTDAGNIGTLHGPSLHHEFELMAGAGLTPAQVLRAATFGAARVMGREKELGTLEKGKFADLLVLGADPLADVKNLRRIEKVMKGGKLLDPKDLLKRANEATAEAPRAK